MGPIMTTALFLVLGASCANAEEMDTRNPLSANAGKMIPVITDSSQNRAKLEFGIDSAPCNGNETAEYIISVCDGAAKCFSEMFSDTNIIIENESLEFWTKYHITVVYRCEDESNWNNLEQKSVATGPGDIPPLSWLKANVSGTGTVTVFFDGPPVALPNTTILRIFVNDDSSKSRAWNTTAGDHELEIDGLETGMMTELNAYLQVEVEETVYSSSNSSVRFIAAPPEEARPLRELDIVEVEATSVEVEVSAPYGIHENGWPAAQLRFVVRTLSGVLLKVQQEEFYGDIFKIRDLPAFSELSLSARVVYERSGKSIFSEAKVKTFTTGILEGIGISIGEMIPVSGDKAIVTWENENLLSWTCRYELLKHNGTLVSKVERPTHSWALFDELGPGVDNLVKIRVTPLGDHPNFYRGTSAWQSVTMLPEGTRVPAITSIEGGSGGVTINWNVSMSDRIDSCHFEIINSYESGNTSLIVEDQNRRSTFMEYSVFGPQEFQVVTVCELPHNLTLRLGSGYSYFHVKFIPSKLLAVAGEPTPNSVILKFEVVAMEKNLVKSFIVTWNGTGGISGNQRVNTSSYVIGDLEPGTTLNIKVTPISFKWIRGITSEITIATTVTTETPEISIGCLILLSSFLAVVAITSAIIYWRLRKKRNTSTSSTVDLSSPDDTSP